MNFQTVLIITYGRSGSTLLQGILNSIDDLTIMGENNNFLYDIYSAYNHLEKSVKIGKRIAKNKQLTDNYQHPWFGYSKIDLELFLNDAYLLVKRTIAPPNVKYWGFKEIRYLNIQDLEAYLDFLAKLLPSPCFIFNTRDLAQVKKSGWWAKKDDKEVIQRLTLLEEDFHKYAQKRPRRCYEITYEDVCNKTKKLKELFDFIGVEYEPEKINKALSTEHSSSNNITFHNLKK